MNIFEKPIKITIHLSFVITFLFFSTLNAKNLDKFSKADNVADYFSGIVLLNQNKYEESFKHLKKLNGLEISHPSFSKKYIYSLINTGNIKQAFHFSKKIENQNLDSFESNLIVGIYYLKNDNFDFANKHFLKAAEDNSISLLDKYILDTLNIWSNLKEYQLESAVMKLSQLDNRFQNLKKIQDIFLNCYFDSMATTRMYSELLSDQKSDFSRYAYFYAKYFENHGKKNYAQDVVEKFSKKNPRNILIYQYKIDLSNNQKNFNFSCKKEKDVIAELFYIAANVLSSQSIYQASNFYLNLSKYLNKEFKPFDILVAENLHKIENFSSAKEIYKNLSKYGDAFKWHANKQISKILIKEEKKKESLKLLSKIYNELSIKRIYEIFDYAEFLKNNKEFESSIYYYSQILNKIDTKHPLFPEVTDGRGVAYERVGNWSEAEKDLLASLKASPDQAYVINYLAYSWIEQGVKIEKSLEMLEKANKLKSNDPYIIDSLGWALFKLKRYKESKKYLQLALRLMPTDPIVNDHYGDALWKNGNKIQARYYWKNVLNLDKAEKDLKEKIEIKLIKGL